MSGEPKHVQKFREAHLKQGEQIAAFVEGYIGKLMGSGKDTQHNGVLIVTDQRVAFYRKGLFGEVMETVEIGKITSIERKSMLGHRTLRIHTSHDDLEFKCHEKEREQAAYDAIERWRSEKAAPTPSSAPDHLAQLKKLGELHASGVLTKQEFESKKAELLSRV